MRASNVRNSRHDYARRERESETHDISFLPTNLVYASTEGGAICGAMAPGRSIKSVGLPFRGKEIKIVSPETGGVLGPNQVSEAFVRSNELSSGYLSNEKANADGFTKDGFFRTGDAMFYDENGFFFVADRYKDVIKVDTNQVSPQELEEILLSHESVQEAAVVGLESIEHGQIPKAFVVVKEGSESEQLRDELLALVNEQVGDWKQLRGGLAFLEEMPKISLGKVDRLRLSKRAGEWKKVPLPS